MASELRMSTLTRPSPARPRSRFGTAAEFTPLRPVPDRWRAAGVFFPHCVDCLVGKLDELAALPDNWDGYGAGRLAPAMLAAVRQFLTMLGEERGNLLLKPGTETVCELPRVVPLSSGAIQLEWDRDGRGLELEFETPELIHYLKWQPAQGVKEEGIYLASDLGRSADLIRWALYGNAD